MTTALLQSVKDAASSLTSLLFGVDGSRHRTRVGEILRTDAETANLLLWLLAAGAAGFLVFLSFGLSACYILYNLYIISLWVTLSVAIWLLLSICLYQVRV